MKNEPHTPIMVNELLSYLSNSKINVFFDGTLGAGGHAKAVLQAHPEISHYIGCDKDPEAIEIAKEALTPWGSKLRVFQGGFEHLDEYLKEERIQTVDGFFLTLECHLCN